MLLEYFDKELTIQVSCENRKGAEDKVPIDEKAAQICSLGECFTVGKIVFLPLSTFVTFHFAAKKKPRR